MCVICQKSTSEPLSCPQNLVNRRDPLNVYKDFLENVAEFEKLNALPTHCGILSSGMSDHTIESCMINKASWHLSCHQRFINSKLQRGKERKRKLDAEIENCNEMFGSVTHRSKRQSIDNSVEKKHLHFL